MNGLSSSLPVQITAFTKEKLIVGESMEVLMKTTSRLIKSVVKIKILVLLI